MPYIRFVRAETERVERSRAALEELGKRVSELKARAAEA
jgi:hypothetical protein